jgi:hypothetical protein
MSRPIRQCLVPSLSVLGACVAGVAFVTCVPASSAAQTPKAWTVGRTPDGQPDLRGTWVNFDSTPFETAGTAPAAPAAVPPTGVGINPPSHWTDHDSPMKAPRPSMVIDPPDGRVPVMKWAEDRRAYDLDHVADNWVHQTPWERCITRGIPAGMFPAGYNNGYQFIQTAGYVVIVYEMIHEARVIPLDGRPHVGANIRTWDGDARGHWEGTTLVVDTTNYNDKGSIATSAATGRIRGIPQSQALHVVERFTPVDANTIQYRVTVDDKNVYTRPWTVEMPLTRDSKYHMFEYACEEGNYATPNILAGGRAEERSQK